MFARICVACVCGACLPQVVMTAISSHPESKPLMIKCIQCLDNIAMANQEHAALVIEVRAPGPESTPRQC